MSSPAPASALLRSLEQHYEELVAFVARHFGHRGFAREVVHEVCVELIERPPQQEIRAPMAFLRQISRHRAIDQCRANDARSAWCESVDELPEHWAHHEDGAHALQTQQHLQALAAVLHSLPERARQAYLLCRIHGMAQQDVADAMGISRNMVAQHMARATQLIAQRWELASALKGRR